MTAAMQKRKVGSTATAEVKAKAAKIEAICAAHRVPLAAAAPRFVLGHPSVATVIPGAKSRAEAEQNARGMNVPIPAAFWAELKAEGLIRADAPTTDARASRS